MSFAVQRDWVKFGKNSNRNVVSRIQFWPAREHRGIHHEPLRYRHHRRGHGGIGAARTLHEGRQRVVLLDKGRAVGGRVCSRHQDGCIFDHGAQNIKPGDSALARTARSLPRGLVTPFPCPSIRIATGRFRPVRKKARGREMGGTRRL
jgi:hypothetical protein